MPIAIRNSVRRSRAVVGYTVIAVGLVVGTATIAAAHDFWIVPTAFETTTGGVLERADGLASRAAGTNGDSASVAATVRGFHDALASGDSLRVLSLLDVRVVILESGDEENLAHYRANHLAADIEFARAVRTTPTAIRVTVRGDVAWATSTGITTGTFRGRTINSSGAELMVLTRADSGWRIAAIHWSSHARRSP